jgi:hypothetical protein
MYTGILHLHSYFAYLLLAALIFSIVYILIAYMNKQTFSEKHRKVALIGFIASHLQLLFGLILYFVSPLGMSNISGEVMKNSELRLYAVEHPLTMLIGIILITIGYSKAKKLTDSDQRYKTILIFYIIGLILILSRIPYISWP